MGKKKLTMIPSEPRIFITIATKKDKNIWNSFIFQQNGSIYHRWEWAEIIDKSLGYAPMFFIARDNSGFVEGIVPLFVKKMQNLSMLITLPCIGYIDPLTKHPSVTKMMLIYIAGWARKNHMLLEMSWSQNLKQNSKNLFQHSDNICKFTTDTRIPYDRWSEKSLYSDVKKRLRNAQGKNIVIRTVGLSKIQKFYFYYLHIMKRVGVTAFPLPLFTQTFYHLKHESVILEASIDGKPKAYSWGFITKNTIYLWKNGYIRGKTKESVYHDVLLNKFIQIACEQRNIFWVDSGTAWCTGGLADYKRHWGFVANPIYVLCNRDEPKYSLTRRDKIKQIFIKKCPFFVYTWLVKRNRL